MHACYMQCCTLHKNILYVNFLFNYFDLTSKSNIINHRLVIITKIFIVKNCILLVSYLYHTCIISVSTRFYTYDQLQGGEVLVGYWEDGVPTGPFFSREQSRDGGTFSCIRIAFMGLSRAPFRKMASAVQARNLVVKIISIRNTFTLFLCPTYILLSKLKIFSLPSNLPPSIHTHYTYLSK